MRASAARNERPLKRSRREAARPLEEEYEPPPPEEEGEGGRRDPTRGIHEGTPSERMPWGVDAVLFARCWLVPRRRAGGQVNWTVLAASSLRSASASGTSGATGRPPVEK